MPSEVQGYTNFHDGILTERNIYSLYRQTKNKKLVSDVYDCPGYWHHSLLWAARLEQAFSNSINLHFFTD
jgi:hypothetical protein